MTQTGTGEAQPRTRKISKHDAIRIFRRDGWLCHWCRKPVIFAPVLRYLEQLARERGFLGRLAYQHNNWSRPQAPLLDELGAVIDHVNAYVRHGAHNDTNWVTACNKCNTRKGADLVDRFAKRVNSHKVKGGGDPVHWDGLSSVFIVLAEQGAKNAGDGGWLAALKA